MPTVGAIDFWGSAGPAAAPHAQAAGTLPVPQMNTSYTAHLASIRNVGFLKPEELQAFCPQLEGSPPSTAAGSNSEPESTPHSSASVQTGTLALTGSSEVTCNVYYQRAVTTEEGTKRRAKTTMVDLSWASYVRQDILGTYHVGVSVYGREFAFGNYRGVQSVHIGDESSGVRAHMPERAGISNVFKSGHSLGCTSLIEAEVLELATRLANNDFQADTYNRVNHNCTDFARRFCEGLGVNPPQDWCYRGATTARWLGFGDAAKTEEDAPQEDDEVDDVSREEDVIDVDEQLGNIALVADEGHAAEVRAVMPAVTIPASAKPVLPEAALVPTTTAVAPAAAAAAVPAATAVSLATQMAVPAEEHQQPGQPVGSSRRHFTHRRHRSEGGEPLQHANVEQRGAPDNDLQDQLPLPPPPPPPPPRRSQATSHRRHSSVGSDPRYELASNSSLPPPPTQTGGDSALHSSLPPPPGQKTLPGWMQAPLTERGEHGSSRPPSLAVQHSSNSNNAEFVHPKNLRSLPLPSARRQSKVGGA